MKRSEFEDQVVKRAWSDPEFKARLLKEPRAAISEELAKIQEGVSIPESVEVTVVEESPGKIYMVLPVNPADVTGKAMTEEDLQKVAGGQSTSTTTATTSLDVVQIIDAPVCVSSIYSPE